MIWPYCQNPHSLLSLIHELTEFGESNDYFIKLDVDNMEQFQPSIITNGGRNKESIVLQIFVKLLEFFGIRKK